MPKVAIEAELYERVKEAASTQATSVDDLLDEAVRVYLWEIDRRKISKESRIYRQRHAELKRLYAGKYIALHNGEVVDYDADFHALYQRMRQRFGHIPVMITRVGQEGEDVITRRGFRFARSEQ